MHTINGNILRYQFIGARSFVVQLFPEISHFALKITNLVCKKAQAQDAISFEKVSGSFSRFREQCLSFSVTLFLVTAFGLACR